MKITRSIKLAAGLLLLGFALAGSTLPTLAQLLRRVVPAPGMIVEIVPGESYTFSPADSLNCLVQIVTQAGAREIWYARLVGVDGDRPVVRLLRRYPFLFAPPVPEPAGEVQ